MNGDMMTYIFGFSQRRLKRRSQKRFTNVDIRTRWNLQQTKVCALLSRKLSLEGISNFSENRSMRVISSSASPFISYALLPHGLISSMQYCEKHSVSAPQYFGMLLNSMPASLCGVRPFSQLFEQLLRTAWWPQTSHVKTGSGTEDIPKKWRLRNHDSGHPSAYKRIFAGYSNNSDYASCSLVTHNPRECLRLVWTSWKKE